MSDKERAIWLEYVTFLTRFNADELKILDALIDRDFFSTLAEVVS